MVSIIKNNPPTTPAARQLAERYGQEVVQQEKRKKPARRTSAGLRDVLFDELDAFREGRGDPERAKAVASLATAVIKAAKLEIEYRNLNKEDRAAVGEMPLGSQSEAAPQLEHKTPEEDDAG